MATKKPAGSASPKPEGAPKDRGARKDVAASANVTTQTASQPAPAPDAPADEHIKLQISEGAYYRAQQRGFSPGYEKEDWLAAEAELLQRLKEGSPKG